MAPLPELRDEVSCFLDDFAGGVDAGFSTETVGGGFGHAFAVQDAEGFLGEEF